MLATGTRLGPYEILAPIGAGGMGEVYRGRDLRLDRTVAIKVSTVKFSERFEREARAVAALNHPNICTLYDVGPDYLVMEFVDGTPLKGPLPLEKAVEYAGLILDALEAAHRKGITHRDLKPDNVLVTKQGIKLLDFGLAKHQTAPGAEDGATVSQALTSEGEIVGTLQYMSPEQLQGKPADARSDLFSFGCVLYETLTGKRAFEGQTAASVIAAILEREPAPLDVAPPLDRVIRACLAKDPDRRFQNALDLKRALLWAASNDPAARPVSTRSHSRLGMAIALAAALALGGWAVSIFHRAPSAPPRAIRLALDPPEDGRFIFGENVGGIALSPDGRTAAFVAFRDGVAALWTRDLDGSSARQLPGTESASYPFWSPDGASIAFFTRSALLRIDKSSGTPLKVCDVISGRGGAWTSDHRILIGSLTAGLFTVPDSGGALSPLTTLDPARGETCHRWPQVLPGGRFLYWSRGKADVQGVYAASLSKPAEAVKLAFTNANALFAPGSDGRGFLLWLRGETLVAREFDPAGLKLLGEEQPVADPVTRNGGGQMNLAAAAGGLLMYSSWRTLSQFAWIDRAAPAARPLRTIGKPGEYNMFRLSFDGRYVAVAEMRPGANDVINLLEVERGVSSPITSDLNNASYPIWSPLRPTIMFTMNPTRNLFLKDAGGTGAEIRVGQSPNYQAPWDWSRDGRWVLFGELDPATQRDLWYIPMTPEGTAAGEPKLYLRTPYNELFGRFSHEPNPHWVAYQSNESGHDEVYIDSFPRPRSRVRISTEGGTNPQWGAGGRELFYVSRDFKLMSVDLTLTADSAQPSAPREMFPLPAVDFGSSPYDTALDGRRFLVRAVPERGASQPLTVIVNWPALLKDAKK